MEYKGIFEKSVDYFYSLIDDQGILQFSKIQEKDFENGYAIEDQARALIVAIKLQDDELIRKLIKIILRSLDDKGGVKLVWNKDGEYQVAVDNFGEASAEVIWGLSSLPKRYLTPTIRKHIKYLTEGIINSSYSRAWAYALIGISQMGDHKNVEELANKLLMLYKVSADKDWMWYEDWLYYANAILPWSLIEAYKVSGNEEYLTTGMMTMDFLINNQQHENVPITIGNKGWWKKGTDKPVYEQQPIDIAYTTLACLKIAEITKIEEYGQKAKWFFQWFYGNNLKKAQMIREDGGAYDGLGMDGPNLNSGAESTICYLIAGLSI